MTVNGRPKSTSPREAVKTDVIGGLLGTGSVYAYSTPGTLDINVAQGQSYVFSGARRYVPQRERHQGRAGHADPRRRPVGGHHADGQRGQPDPDRGEHLQGLTTINGGTLQLGNATATGSIDSSSGVVNNGALLFTPRAVNFNVAVSGGGNLVQTARAARSRLPAAATPTRRHGHRQFLDPGPGRPARSPPARRSKSQPARPSTSANSPTVTPCRRARRSAATARSTACSTRRRAR